MSQENYFVSPLFIGTNWFPPHSFVPTLVIPSFHDLTSSHKHVLPPIAEKFLVLFLVQSRPNTIANQQRIVIWQYEGRWNATCPCETSSLSQALHAVYFCNKILYYSNFKVNHKNCLFLFGLLIMIVKCCTLKCDVV